MYDRYAFNSFSSFVITTYCFPILNIIFFYNNSCYPTNKMNSAMKTCRQNGRPANPKDHKLCIYYCKLTLRLVSSEESFIITSWRLSTKQRKIKYFFLYLRKEINIFPLNKTILIFDNAISSCEDFCASRCLDDKWYRLQETYRLNAFCSTDHLGNLKMKIVGISSL